MYDNLSKYEFKASFRSWENENKMKIENALFCKISNRYSDLGRSGRIFEFSSFLKI